MLPTRRIECRYMANRYIVGRGTGLRRCHQRGERQHVGIPENVRGKRLGDGDREAFRHHILRLVLSIFLYPCLYRERVHAP